MAITSESQIIDIVTISNGCSIIEEAARDYTTCANRVKEAADICSPEALAVEKKSMQPSLEELAASISTIEENVNTFTAQIRNVAQKIYARQWEELNAYRAEQARIAAEKAAAEEAARQAAAQQAAQQTANG